MAKKDLSDSIERLEAMEDRLGVELSALSAFIEVYDDGDVHLNVNGELVVKGGELSADIEIQVASYDEKGRVIGNDSISIYAEDFFGIEIFDRICFLPLPPTRIRIFPKKG